MAKRRQVILHGIPGWAIRICRRIATWQGFFWTNLVGLLIGLLCTWLTSTSSTNYHVTPLGAMLMQWWVGVAVFGAGWLVFGLSALLGRLPEMKKPLIQIRKEYLANVIAQREKLEIEGIPAPLIYEAVTLEAIFILPRFRPHQALVDQGLTEALRKRLRSGMASGEVATEEEGVLIEYARRYEQQPGWDRSVEIDYLWQQLSREEPAAVIQGTPGMGKSTFLMRLALHMARRGLGKKEEGLGKQQIEPVLVPLFLSLGPYATFRQQHQKQDEKGKSIWAYLQTRPREMIELSSAETVAWLRQELMEGHCLVLFDALDEVSDPGERREVQEAIQAFVTEARSQTGEGERYNRFLITSRIAGYDPHAFAYYHYTLTELTPEQISDFLPRWCRASAYRKLGRAGLNEEQILQQAAEIEQDLRSALEDHQGIKEMAENPFLLTLLALLRQNNYALPHRRIELYQKVAEVLLIHRNELRHLPGIPENLAIQRLGPLAYQMQANKNSFVMRSEAHDALITVLVQEEKMPAELAPRGADDFLQRVRERGGIFVFRAGDFLGFFHRTFQEYFAARHLLNLLAAHPVSLRQELLEKARRRDALWREPFLLAMAYKNSEPSSEAQELLHALLTGFPMDDRAQRTHDILLAGQCLIEAKNAALPYDLVQKIVLALLEIYTLALEVGDDATCRAVEQIMVAALRDISNEAEHSATLLTLREALDEQRVLAPGGTSGQLALLILLTMTGRQLRRCKDLVFRQLVPLLLGLADQPKVGSFLPTAPASQPTSEISDWALSALQALDERGPAGEALRAESQLFEPHLKQLARISLERGLLTPALVPFSQEQLARFEQTIQRWLDLQKRRSRQRGEQVLAEAIEIQRELLQAAETLWYPTYGHLLALLKCSQDQTIWQSIWKAYLRERMESGSFQEYQVCTLLWLTLFPDPESQKALATNLKIDLFRVSLQQRFARLFARKVVSNLRDLSDLSYFSYFSNLSYLSYLRDLSNFSYLSYLRDLSNFSYLSYLRDLRDLSNLSNLSNFSYLSNLSNLSNLRELRDLRDLSYLSKIVFDPSITKEIEKQAHVSDNEKRVELLWLLMGRVLQMQEEEERDAEREEEIQRIVEVALTWSKENQEASEVVRTLLRFLPARVEGEITLLVRLAYEAQDADQRTAYAAALQRARPYDDRAWAALEAAQTSGVAEIEKAARKRLALRK